MYSMIILHIILNLNLCAASTLISIFALTIFFQLTLNYFIHKYIKTNTCANLLSKVERKLLLLLI